MERLEIGRSILPRRLAQGIDDKRSHDHHDTSDDKYGIPHGIASYCNLSWRDEAEDERQQRTEETQTAIERMQREIDEKKKQSIVFPFLF